MRNPETLGVFFRAPVVGVVLLVGGECASSEIEVVDLIVVEFKLGLVRGGLESRSTTVSEAAFILLLVKLIA
jgi:hypothetical protein